MSAGFDLDPQPRDRNEYREDPTLGLIVLKGLWVPNADLYRDADADERVSFQIRERWSAIAEPESQIQEQGLHLVGYSYNGHIDGPSLSEGDRNHRHDFDPLIHPEMPYHRHPFGAGDDYREREDPVSLDDAIRDFLNVVKDEIEFGSFNVR